MMHSLSMILISENNNYFYLMIFEKYVVNIDSYVGKTEVSREPNYFLTYYLYILSIFNFDFDSDIHLAFLKD